MAAKRFSVSLVNWEEFQERADRANYTWFKIHSKTVTGHFWQNATLEQKALWFSLLCMRNGQQSDVIHTLDFVLSGYSGVKLNQIEESIIGLIGLGVVRDESGLIPGDTLAVRGQNPGLEIELEKEREREVDQPAAAPLRIAPSLVGDYSLKAKTIIHACDMSTQESWLAAYPDPAWIKQEINKAAAWISSNPKRAPKKYPAFMGNWLSRGWEKHRKTIPSIQPQGEEPEWKRLVREQEAKNAAS
jgi:hypothetical protein